MSSSRVSLLRKVGEGKCSCHVKKEPTSFKVCPLPRRIPSTHLLSAGRNVFTWREEHHLPKALFTNGGQIAAPSHPLKQVLNCDLDRSVNFNQYSVAVSSAMGEGSLSSAMGVLPHITATAPISVPNAT